MRYRMPNLDDKAPFDRFSVVLDFADILLPGDTIATQEVVATPNDLIIDNISIVNSPSTGAVDQALSIRLSAGSANIFYTITTQIDTTAQEQFQRSFTVTPENL